jgi:hypothetical protein
MVQATMGRVLVAVALAGVSTTVFSEPVYLSCVYESGPPFALVSPLTFAFDESRKEILLGNGGACEQRSGHSHGDFVLTSWAHE